MVDPSSTRATAALFPWATALAVGPGSGRCSQVEPSTKMKSSGFRVVGFRIFGFRLQGVKSRETFLRLVCVCVVCVCACVCLRTSVSVSAENTFVVIVPGLLLCDLC